MATLDRIDKYILMDLSANCRMTYKTLGARYEMTPNGARTRVLNLIESGVIEEFTCYLSPAMVSTEHIYALMKTDGIRTTDLIEEIAQHPNVILTGFLASDVCSVYADYTCNDELLALTSYLRQRKGILTISLYNLVVSKGGWLDLKDRHLRVLRCLYVDPRMSYVDISEKTGLTTRKVRKAVDQLLESNAVYFTLRWNPNAAGSTAYMAKIEYDDTLATPSTLLHRLDDEFSDEHCLPYDWIAANKPVVFAVFVVDHLRRAQHISNSIRQKPEVTAVKTLIPYPTKKSNGIRRTKLAELVSLDGI